MSSDPRLQPALRWLAATGRRPATFQVAAWTAYLNGESGLIHAPTGTGKTLAAWLGPVLEAGAEGASDRTPLGPKLLWITPLRALANDLVGNLREPLGALGVGWRVEQRTGDTSSSQRARQRKRPPDALVTTPETLSMLFSHADTEAQLAAVRAVIVDEWHELLGSKRGVLLELARSPTCARCRRRCAPGACRQPYPISMKPCARSSGRARAPRRELFAATLRRKS